MSATYSDCAVCRKIRFLVDRLNSGKLKFLTRCAFQGKYVWSILLDLDTQITNNQSRNIFPPNTILHILLGIESLF